MYGVFHKSTYGSIVFMTRRPIFFIQSRAKNIFGHVLTIKKNEDMSRFRPTSFQVAFGNTPSESTTITQQPPAADVIAPPPSPSPVVLPPPSGPIEIIPVQITSTDTAEFERIIVREQKCTQCCCYACAHRQRIHEYKLNLIIFILVVLAIMLFMHTQK